ncbi:MAG: hypothetical protein ACE5QV_06325 [Fidelibacterota bacterium]
MEEKNIYKGLNFKDEEILLKLQGICERLGVEVRYESGDFEGGLCKVNDKQILVVNKSLPLSSQIAIMAKALGSMDLDNVYIIPVIRELLNSYKDG